MCGFAGIFEYGRSRGGVDAETVIRMRDSLRHRGPDGEGLHITEDRRLGLGHRRLAIVDPSHGDQPMFGAAGECLVFNGEIYNYPALRADLERDGARFATDCDTEVLLHLYRREGEGMLERLTGMFAFALWDARLGRLLLARDPAGEKPLYWTQRDGRLLFGSEIKALLEHPAITAEVNDAAVAPYLANLVTPAPDTLFAGISKLRPGSAMRCDAGGPSIFRYRKLAEPRGFVETPHEPAAAVRGLLDRSIDARLMSDVPVGVLLSGGLDSTTLVGALHARDRNLPTFSVGFSEPELDERHHARRVAEHFGTEHHEVELSESMAIDFLPTLIAHQDEPLGDPVCMPLHFVCALAREQGVKVVLGGEGADELFWGYPRYLKTMARWRQISFALRLPGPVRASLPGLARGAGPGYISEALEGVAAGRLLPMHLPVGLPRAQRERVLDGPAPIGWAPEPRGAGEDSLEALAFDTQEYEFEVRLPELLLMRLDRFSMSSGVEARVPFLDPDLVRYVYGLSLDNKLVGGLGKVLLRDAVGDLVPDWVLARRKQGFGAPVVSWLQLRFGELLRELMAGGELDRYLNREATERLIADRQLGAWPILNFALWHHRWIEGRSIEDLIDRVMAPRAA
jgi:asparagine synthase (glutamine-hydrolysing)